MRLHFLGANQQVTGSRYLLEAGGLRVLIDCGLFQERRFLERNWDTPPFDPRSVDVGLLTHAHLDHTGLLPRLAGAGLDCPIHCTEPTADLAEIVVLDAAKIQEEDARYKRKRHRKENRKGPRPVVPLYTMEEAKKIPPMLQGTTYGRPLQLNDNVTATFHEAGHILGSAMLDITVTQQKTTRRLLFSGDLGQHDKPLIDDPTHHEGADYVIMESTYGNRDHRDEGDVAARLADIVNDTAQRGGNLVIPTFAIERAQELVYHIGRLRRADHIPDLPVYLDSPMAVDVTEVFRKSRAYLDAETHRLFAEGEPPLRYPGLKLVRSVEGSMKINGAGGTSIIMSASGMCTAGRIKHHLKRNITRSDSTILFVGFQAEGTLGRHILRGAEEVRIHGRPHRIRARIAQIHGFSAHGDRSDLLDWLGGFRRTPEQLFLTHGEEDAAAALAVTIREKLGWGATVPEYGHVATLP